MVRVPLAIHVDQPEVARAGRTPPDACRPRPGNDRPRCRATCGTWRACLPRGTGRRRRRTRRRSRRPSRVSGRRPGRSPPPFARPRSPRPRTRRRPLPRPPARGGPRRLRSPRGASRAAAGHFGSRPRRVYREVSRAPPGRPDAGARADARAPRTRHAEGPPVRSPWRAEPRSARSTAGTARASARRTNGSARRACGRRASARARPRSVPAPRLGSADRGTGPGPATRRRHRALRGARR